MEERVVQPSNGATIRCWRKLNKIQRRCRHRPSNEEGHHESTSDEHWHAGGKGIDNRPNTYTQATEEHVLLSTVPICHPDKEGTAHIADLENGKDDTGAGVAFGRKIEVGSVVREGVDRTHERTVEA